MDMEAWPFLFGPGRVLDYQFIICPAQFRIGSIAPAFRGFVASLEESATLGGRIIVPKEPLLRDWIFACFCKKGEVDGKPARDIAGRPIEVVYGVAVKAPRERTAEFEEGVCQLLEKNTDMLQTHFERFWPLPRAPENPFSFKIKGAEIEETPPE